MGTSSNEVRKKLAIRTHPTISKRQMIGCTHLSKHAGGFDSPIVRQHPQKVRLVRFDEPIQGRKKRLIISNLHLIKTEGF